MISYKLIRSLKKIDYASLIIIPITVANYNIHAAKTNTAKTRLVNLVNAIVREDYLRTIEDQERTRKSKSFFQKIFDLLWR